MHHHQQAQRSPHEYVCGPEAVGAFYKILGQSFKAAWAEWSTRTAPVVVTSRETMPGDSAWSASPVARRMLVCLAPELKRVYGEPL